MATVAGLRQSQRAFRQCGKRQLDVITEVQDTIQRLAKIHRDRVKKEYVLRYSFVTFDGKFKSI